MATTAFQFDLKRMLTRQGIRFHARTIADTNQSKRDYMAFFDTFDRIRTKSARKTPDAPLNPGVLILDGECDGPCFRVWHSTPGHINKIVQWDNNFAFRPIKHERLGFPHK